MILYKYVKPDGIDILEKSRVKVSGVHEFNDPFELIPSVSDITERQIYKYVIHNDRYIRHLYDLALSTGRTNKPYETFKSEIKNSYSKRINNKYVSDFTKSTRDLCKKLQIDSKDIVMISCFCGEAKGDYQEILMWAHYADAHKGFRIIFDSDYFGIKNSKLIKIRYSKNRAQLNPISYWQNGANKISEIYEKVLRQKSIAWAYENEHRLFVSPQLCEKEGDRIFVNISLQAIIGIDCGLQCKSEQVEIIKRIVKDKYESTVKIRKTCIDNYTFKLKYCEC